jgi:endonuclease/exonuclease/phosphatase family metal-dependent hydrolase
MIFRACLPSPQVHIISIQLLLWLTSAGFADGPVRSFTVATYNLNNYLDETIGTREAKSTASKAKIRESILTLKPDVLAVQEMGTRQALTELRDTLRTDGHDFPYVELVPGYDTNIHVAILSRYPIAAMRSLTNAEFLLHGRRFHTSRGFGEADIKVSDTYQFTLLAIHLKSRRPVPEADEAQLRAQEAIVLRNRIEALTAANPELNLVVVGDFNDTKDSPAVKTILGKGKLSLVDTRPAERNGDNLPSPVPYLAPRNVTWTYFYGKDDTYSRIDFILISRAMAREWQREGTYVLSLPNWGLASDHRPIIAQFRCYNR